MRPDFLKLNDADVGVAAQTYFLGGFRPFPCRPGGKEPMTRHGCNDADSRIGMEPEAVVQLAEDMLCATAAGVNLGLATGHEVDVLDVDVKHGLPGLKALRRLQDEGLLTGAVGLVQTPSGGRHVYFPASGTRSGSISALGLDWKAARGYVIAPPSELAMFMSSAGTPREVRWATARYRWIWTRPIEQGAPFNWDACRRVFGVEASRAHGTLRGDKVDPALTPIEVDRLATWLLTSSDTTHRNGCLYWAACRAVEVGATTEAALAPLVAASLALSRPGERRDAEVLRTVRSALRAYGLEPS